MMLFEDASVQAVLGRMITRLEKSVRSRDDLMQEAVVHLWQEEQARPGRRLSWYLRSVWCHLRHLIKRGRSVDSPKRAAGLTALSTNHDGFDEWLNSIESDQDIMSEIGFNDLLSVLRERLGKIDNTILYALAGGLGHREIGRNLRVSHKFVARHRRQIASVAITLGIDPLPRLVRAAS